MSDRKRAIETLKQLRLDYEEFYEEHNNEVTQAYDIAIASLETDEAYQLEYEQPEFCKDCIDREAVYYYISSHINEIITESGTDKNAHTNAILRSLANGVKTMPSVLPKVTKNDLDFKLKDYVSREAVRRIIKSPRTQEQMLNALNSLRNVTECKAKDCISRKAVLDAIDSKAWEFCDYLISKGRNDEQKPVLHFADNLRECVSEELPSVTPQELRVDFKELKRKILMKVDGGTDDAWLAYGEVCNRISNSIDEYVQNIQTLPSVTPQEPTEWEHDHAILKAYSDGVNEVLDKIRAEIDNALSDGMIHKKTILGIIDKYKAETEQKDVKA